MRRESHSFALIVVNILDWEADEENTLYFSTIMSTCKGLKLREFKRCSSFLLSGFCTFYLFLFVSEDKKSVSALRVLCCL